MTAPTRVGTRTISDSSANRSSASFNHTTTTDTGLLLVWVMIEGSEAVNGIPTFDGNNLTLIHDTGDAGSNAHVRMYVYGLISPGEVIDGGIFVDFVSAVNPSSVACVNWADVDTTSVGDATNFLSDDVNTTAGTTGVHASGGSAGNTLFVAGCGQGEDMQPADADGSFVEVWDQQTGGSAANDFGHTGEELRTGLPSAVTITYGASDQNTSVFIELVAGGPAGRVMSSLAGAGGLAGPGGIAGQGGGLAS